MNAIISFSLYGSKPLYCEGAIRNLELARVVYPGWRCRFYVDDAVPGRYVGALKAGDAEVVHVARSLGPVHGLYWRFWAAADPEIDRCIVRDADSRLNPREKAAVDEWIGSGKSFHVMRDHPLHDRRILGGMWGCIGGRLPHIAALIDRWGRFQRRGQDQEFLSEVIFPLVKEDYLCHDSFGHFDDARPFPPHAPLVGTSFVGQDIGIDKPRIDVWERVNSLAERLPANCDPGCCRQEYARVANELMLADEECARLRLKQEPRPFALLHKVWAARRWPPASFSIRNRLARGRNRAGQW